MQIDKLCSIADNMSQSTSNFTPTGDPYGIPAAMKVLKSYSNEISKSSPFYFFALKLIKKNTLFLWSLMRMKEFGGLRWKWRIILLFLIYLGLKICIIKFLERSLFIGFESDCLCFALFVDIQTLGIFLYLSVC